MKWLNRLSNEQLMDEMETQKRYLKSYLAKENRDFARDYIKHMFKVINTCKVILKSREVNA